MERTVRRCLVTAALCAIAVVGIYLLFIRTRIGQELDDGAYEGRAAVRPAATRATDRLLDAITKSSLTILGSAVVLIAVLRARWRLALGALLAMGGALLTSEVLKRVLSRPDVDGVQGIAGNSYPSGHATIAAVLALGLVMVMPRRWRAGAAVFGALFTTAVATGVLASGWHRPSDSLGALAVALGWFSATVAGLVWWRGAGADDEADEAPTSVVVAAATAVLAVTVAALVLTVDRAGDLVAVRFRAEYVLAVVAVDAAAIAVVATFVVLLRGCSLDAPRRQGRRPE